MTNPTLERAARALQAAANVAMQAGSPVSFDDLPEADQDLARTLARAVLMAVRSEMCDTVCVRALDDILSGSGHERATEDNQQG